MLQMCSVVVRSVTTVSAILWGGTVLDLPPTEHQRLVRCRSAARVAFRSSHFASKENTRSVCRAVDALNMMTTYTLSSSPTSDLRVYRFVNDCRRRH